MKTLPYATAPFNGECFSSWLTRLADSYAETPLGIIRDAYRASGEVPANLISRPEYPSEKLVSCLARRTDVPRGEIEATTMYAREKLTGMNGNDQVVSRLLHGERIAWCPVCLSENGYWHLWWSSPAFHACPKHHTRLMTQCSSCRRSPRPARYYSSYANVTDCASCGQSLMESVPPEETNVQTTLVRWSEALSEIRNGHITLDERYLPVEDFLSVIRVLHEVILPSVFARDDYEDWAWCYLHKSETLNQSIIEMAIAATNLVGYNTLDSEAFASLVGWLMLDWTKNFRKFVSVLDPSRMKLLLRRRDRLPEELSNILADIEEPSHLNPGALAA